jgi:hypothetical protein
MTSLTSQDGKLVVRDGKLGTEQACCCDTPDIGACCYCRVYESLVGNGNTFELEEDAAALVDENNAELAQVITDLENNNYTCIESEPSFYFQNDESLFQVDLAEVFAGCCGTVDEEASPVYAFLYPCLPGPERECQDNVSSEDCAARCNGVHHPGEACEDEPCNPLP